MPGLFLLSGVFTYPKLCVTAVGLAPKTAPHPNPLP
jgi:hypothetical protein